MVPINNLLCISQGQQAKFDFEKYLLQFMAGKYLMEAVI